MKTERNVDSRPGADNTPWWREGMVWLIIALPVSAVLASLATVYIAAREADDLVTTGYSKTGMAVEVQQSALEQARKLGLAGNLRYQNGLLTLRLTPTPAAGESLSSQGLVIGELALHVVHPTLADLDQKIALQPLEQGQYQARIDLTGEGKRHLILEPADRSWQLQGEWHAPFKEETSLSALGAVNPTTHP